MKRSIKIAATTAAAVSSAMLVKKALLFSTPSGFLGLANAS